MTTMTLLSSLLVSACLVNSASAFNCLCDQGYWGVQQYTQSVLCESYCVNGFTGFFPSNWWIFLTQDITLGNFCRASPQDGEPDVISVWSTGGAGVYVAYTFEDEPVEVVLDCDKMACRLDNNKLALFQENGVINTAWWFVDDVKYPYQPCSHQNLQSDYLYCQCQHAFPYQVKPVALTADTTSCSQICTQQSAAKTHSVASGSEFEPAEGSYCCVGCGASSVVPPVVRYSDGAQNTTFKLSGNAEGDWNVFSPQTELIKYVDSWTFQSELLVVKLSGSNMQVCDQAQCYPFDACEQPACEAECTWCYSETECAVCSSNYVLQGGDCNPIGGNTNGTTSCEANCEACTSPTVCIDCKQGFYLDSDDCVPCPAIDQCVSSTVCASATTSQCTQCASGYYLVNLGADQCGQCHGTCQECDGPSLNNCVECSPPYFFYSNACVLDCPAGQRGDVALRACVPCDDVPNCLTTPACNSAAISTCDACTQGHFLSGDRTSCVACSPIGSCLQTSCLDATTSQCLRCDNGFHSRSSKCVQTTTLEKVNGEQSKITSIIVLGVMLGLEVVVNLGLLWKAGKHYKENKVLYLSSVRLVCSSVWDVIQDILFLNHVHTLAAATPFTLDENDDTEYAQLEMLTLVFIVLPFMANLAALIFMLHRTKHPPLRAWMHDNLALTCVFVVLSGTNAQVFSLLASNIVPSKPHFSAPQPAEFQYRLVFPIGFITLLLEDIPQLLLASIIIVRLGMSPLLALQLLSSSMVILLAAVRYLMVKLTARHFISSKAGAATKGKTVMELDALDDADDATTASKTTSDPTSAQTNDTAV